MSSTQDSPYRTLKAKKPAANPPALANPGHSGPTTFFLRSEKEVDKTVPRGRKTSRDTVTWEEESIQTTPMASAMGDSAFGVKSLEETMSFSSDTSLSRTDSNISEASVDASTDTKTVAGRKRKAGNPVHPKIMATGQRILSAEQSGQATDSPISQRSADSPFRSVQGRRNSASSSINLSQPLTPLKMSPRPESAMPSTPRSGSPKSFRLSDEEQSIASDAGSQAIASSSGDENEPEADTDGKDESMPQLVMPSVAMPTRRPFTERGKQMGRLTVMVVGARGVGKTSLIQSICRVCEDVVHMDAITGSTSTFQDNGFVHLSEGQIVEIGASTRPYPSWWTDFQSRRMLLGRKSMGEGVLERNITFIDTPGFDSDGRSVQQILRHFQASLSRTAKFEKLNDSELISVLSGEGGVQIDAVLYLFDPLVFPAERACRPEEVELLRYLCKWTNVIPLIAHSDEIRSEKLAETKKQLLDMFRNLQLDLCISPHILNENDDAKTEDEAPNSSEDVPSEPYLISSALADDPETIDASILMSSTYLQPLIPSDLDYFLQHFLEPDNLARLRHLSATKFLLWRQENLASHLNFTKQNNPFSLTLSEEPSSPLIAATTGTILEDPSKVLVPHGSSSYYRSTSPSASESSAGNGNVTGTSAQALARYNDQINTTNNIPFRQVRLAKWAQDLQRSLDNERKRYKNLFINNNSNSNSNPPSNFQSRSRSAASPDSENPPSDPNTSLITTSQPAKGHLGGALGIIDPRDPLGLLAFSQAFRRRGKFALQVAGSCGLLGAVVWWVARNWMEVQEFFRGEWGLGQGHGMPVSVVAVPAPTRGWFFEDVDWRGLVGWVR